jgi:hypothetical protein
VCAGCITGVVPHPEEAIPALALKPGSVRHYVEFHSLILLTCAFVFVCAATAYVVVPLPEEAIPALALQLVRSTY